MTSFSHIKEHYATKMPEVSKHMLLCSNLWLYACNPRYQVLYCSSDCRWASFASFFFFQSGPLGVAKKKKKNVTDNVMIQAYCKRAVIFAHIMSKVR